MKNILITGANKGIGLETAKQLLKNGFYVYLGSRDFKKGLKAAELLKSEGLNSVDAIQIDINDELSVKMARKEIGKKIETLDVLINNAGIAGGFPQTALTAKTDDFKTVFETNLYGVVRTVQAFMDLLQKSPNAKIVNVSSSIGSITLHNDPTWQYYENANLFSVYSSSKAALNMYSTVLAYELQGTPVKVILVDPGYTRTDFNNNQGTGTVRDAANRVTNAVTDDNIETGDFISREYNPETGHCPW